MSLVICPAAYIGNVHDHGDSSLGLVKILDGHVRLDYFNPLPSTFSSIHHLKLNTQSILFTSNFTWMTHDMYQTHRLSNLRNKSASIILEEFIPINKNDADEEEIVNYADENELILKSHKVKSDFYYKDLIEKVKLEFEERKCEKNLEEFETKKKKCDFTGRMCGHTLKNLKDYYQSKIDYNSIYECDDINNRLNRYLNIVFVFLTKNYLTLFFVVLVLKHVSKMPCVVMKRTNVLKDLVN